MDLQHLRTTAVGAARAACALCVDVQRDLVSAGTLRKGDRSPVTVADFGAQGVVSLRLAEAAPEIPLMAEEDADALRHPEQAAVLDQVLGLVAAQAPATDRDRLLAAIDRGAHPGGPDGAFWVLDPIDGTKGFLRGEQYALALGLVEGGRLTLGVLGCPNLPRAGGGLPGCLFVASRGGGAIEEALDGAGRARAVRVSSVGDPAALRFCESVESAHTAHGASARVAELLGTRAEPHRLDSQCKYAAVARGDAEVYLRLPTRKDYEEKVWDHAAGALLVEEAGGTVTDTAGRPLDFTAGRTLKHNAGIIASNGLLHDRIVAAVQTALAAT